MLAYFARSGLWAIMIDQIEHYWNEFMKNSASEKLEEASSLHLLPSCINRINRELHFGHFYSFIRTASVLNSQRTSFNDGMLWVVDVVIWILVCIKWCYGKIWQSSRSVSSTLKINAILIFNDDDDDDDNWRLRPQWLIRDLMVEHKYCLLGRIQCELNDRSSYQVSMVFGERLKPCTG